MKCQNGGNFLLNVSKKNSRYVQIANDSFTAEVVAVLCTLKKIKLISYGHFKTATESLSSLPSLREGSFDQQKCKTVHSKN